MNDLKQASPTDIRNKFSVVMEKMIRELNGTACIELEFFMKPYNSQKMQFWPVSTEVNKSINEGEHLVHPVPVATEK